jgi:hypothetical protein
MYFVGLNSNKTFRSVAVDIVLSVNGKAPVWREETSIRLSDDADYWYLWPRMINDLKNQTGELIDLYDGAEFSGQNLDILETLVGKQLLDLSSKEEEWEVHVGTQTHLVKKEIYKKLIKRELQLKLAKLLFIVGLAKEQSEMVICLGD